MCSAKSSKAELELQYKMAVVETLTADGQDAGMAKGELIPTPDQIELAMYGNDVMDLTSSGLRSI